MHMPANMYQPVVEELGRMLTMLSNAHLPDGVRVNGVFLVMGIKLEALHRGQISKSIW